MLENKIKGCIFGLAIGDAVGLRYENVKPKNINKKNIGKVCFGGSISDDTEHMVIISKSILHTNNVNDFKKDFQKELKKWLLSFPVNIGKTTLKSIFKSFISNENGVAGTGNGSVMRIAAIGLLFHDNPDKLREYSEASCRLTHNSDESVVNSIAIASLVSYVISNDINKNKKPNQKNILLHLRSLSQEDFWIETLNELEEALNSNIEPVDLVYKWTKGKGAVGYTKYSTLLSIYCWLKYYGDYEKTIKEIIACGGDTDTNAAICGSLAGVSLGFDAIDSSYVQKVNDFIINKKTLNNLSLSILNKTDDIKTWKIHYLSFPKNLFSLFYFTFLLTKVSIFSLFGIKH